MKLFEKPIAKAMQGVAKTLEKGEATGADVMKTFIAKQTPGMVAKTAGTVAEVAGFTMYETANNLTKKLLQTDANGQLHLPKDLTEEGLTQYLLKNIPEEFLKQAKGIGEIKAISKLIFMHKGAVVERERVMNENLSKCEMLGKVKVQKAEVDGAEIYAITAPNGNRKIARSPEDVVAYCNVLMQMDMAMNSKTTATETNPNETKVKTPKGLVEKTQTTSPVENVKNKVISEVAKDIKDEGMRLNTPESLDAELAEAEQNPNAPVDNLEALNLVINGKIGNVLKAQYDNASNVFKDIAKKYSSELDQLEKQYGNDKKLFAEKFTEFLADKLGVKGIEPKIVLRDTGDADGFFDWSTGELAVNSKLNNSKDIQTMIAHEFIHVMQFKDMIANRGAEAVSSLLMHDTKFITAKAIELAKNNGADYKSLPVEEQQIYKEACSEMLADEVMEANKGLVDFAQKNPISKGSLNEYLSRIYQNEYENMKTDINSPEYYEQVIENEAYYLGNGQLGLNLKGSVHFTDTKTNTQTKNSRVNVPKGVVQSEITPENFEQQKAEFIKEFNEKVGKFHKLLYGNKVEKISTPEDLAAVKEFWEYANSEDGQKLFSESDYEHINKINAKNIADFKELAETINSQKDLSDDIKQSLLNGAIAAESIKETKEFIQGIEPSDLTKLNDLEDFDRIMLSGSSTEQKAKLDFYKEIKTGKYDSIIKDDNIFKHVLSVGYSVEKTKALYDTFAEENISKELFEKIREGIENSDVNAIKQLYSQTKDLMEKDSDMNWIMFRKLKQEDIPAKIEILNTLKSAKATNKEICEILNKTNKDNLDIAKDLVQKAFANGDEKAEKYNVVIILNKLTKGVYSKEFVVKNTEALLHLSGTCIRKTTETNLELARKISENKEI